MKDISLSNGRRDAVLIEGDLGLLKDVSVFEEKVLVVKGHFGTLRVELSLNDLFNAMRSSVAR